MNCLKRISIIILMFSLPALALINVPIAVLEASYLPVYTDSERNSLVFSMPLALQQFGKKAIYCGYKYSFMFSEFSYGNPNSAKVSVDHILDNKPWVIWGPETNDELDQTRAFLDGLGIPQFSSFAFDNIYGGKNILTLSGNQDVEVKQLFKSIHSMDRIGVVFDPTCTMCKIYLRSIKEQYKSYKLKFYSLQQDSDFIKTEKKVIRDKIKSLVILLYGDTSGKFISKFRKNEPIKFFGTKMFGNEVSSEMMKYDLSKKDISLVRPLPPCDFDTIYFDIYDDNEKHRVFDNSFYMIYFVEKLTEMLCKNKPNNRNDLVQIIKKRKYKFKYVPKYQVLKSNGKKFILIQK